MAKFKDGDVVVCGDDLLQILHVGQLAYFCFSVGKTTESVRPIVDIDTYYSIKKNAVKLYLYRYCIYGAWYITSQYFATDKELTSKYTHVTKIHRIEESAWEPEE